MSPPLGARQHTRASRSGRLPVYSGMQPTELEPTSSRRFLTLDHVAEELGITRAHAYALVRRGEVPAIKVGGGGHWRVERAALEEYIVAAYEFARSLVSAGLPVRSATDDALEAQPSLP